MTRPQRNKKTSLLTNLELEVMRALWDEHPRTLTVREVAERVNANRPKELAYNTVQTMLAILRDKGVVRATRSRGRAFLWQVRLSERDARASMVGDLVQRLFGGDVQPLLLHLVEDEALERSELETLRRRIDEQLTDEAEGPTEEGGEE